MKSLTSKWFKIAQSDYDSAFYLFEGARYPYAIYFLCQSIEKLLKATQIELTESVPKKTHRLENIAHETTLKFSEAQYDQLTELSKIYGKIRYPDMAQESYNTKVKVEPIMEKGKELYQWLFKKLKNQ